MEQILLKRQKFILKFFLEKKLVTKFPKNIFAAVQITKTKQTTSK